MLAIQPVSVDMSELLVMILLVIGIVTQMDTGTFVKLMVVI